MPSQKTRTDRISTIILELTSKRFANESDLAATFLPDFAEALGYKRENLFFDVSTPSPDFVRLDAMVAGSRTSPPWGIFEFKLTSQMGRLHERAREHMLRLVLQENQAHFACLISPIKLIAVTKDNEVETVAVESINETQVQRLVSLLAAPSSLPKPLQPPSPPAEKEHLAQLLKSARTAKTPQEKGYAFEELASQFFADIPGVRVKYRNLTTASSEIDLVVEADADRCPPVFRDFLRFSLVECKNWSKPAGAPEIRDFVSKIEKARSRLGFFFSRNGVTGANNGADALREVRWAVDRLGIFVVVIAEDDLERVVGCASFADLLDRRIDSIRFDLSD